jgi:hypothetical protein
MDDRPNRRLASLFLIAVAIHSAAVRSFAEEPVTPVNDGKKYDLRYKLSTGDVLRYTVDHRAAIRSTIDDTTQEAQTKTESIKAWKVTDVLPNKDIEFMNVVERVHMLNHLPERAPVEYNSATDKVPPPGFEDAAKAIGVPLSVTRITPRGKVVSHKLKLQQSAADQEAQVAIRLPEEPIAVGATWDEPFDVTVQLEGNATKSIQTRRHYELKSVANGIATIDVAYQVLSPIDAKIESQLVQRLMKGTVRFDIEKGRIDSQIFEVDKRILGFAGPTSSMHYIMRMEEKLTDEKVARQPSRKQTQRSSSRPAQRTATGPTTKGMRTR